MSDTELFDRHFASGFDLGWHRDIPKFTPQDWREFLTLSYKLWELEIRRGYFPDKLHSSLYQLVDSTFWDSFPQAAHDPREQVRAALESMISPLGTIDYYEGFHSGRLLEILDDVFGSDRWTDETRQNFLIGLNQAVAGATINIGSGLELLRDQVLYTSQHRQRPKSILIIEGQSKADLV